MENSEDSGAGQKSLGKPLILSAVFIAAVLFLLSTDINFKPFLYVDGGRDHRRVFDQYYLTQAEMNVYAKIPKLEFTRRCTEYKFDGINNSVDLMQNPPPKNILKNRRILFHLKCDEPRIKPVPIYIEDTNVSKLQAGVLKLTLPSEPIKKIDRTTSYYGFRQHIGIFYADLGDESVRQKLNDGKNKNIWERFTGSGKISFALVYNEGGSLSRTVIKIWHISIFIWTSLLALRIGLAILMGASSKKDARYKTGYKNNQSTSDLASGGLEMTRWATPYIFVNFHFSVWVLSYLFVAYAVLADTSQFFGAVVGMLVFYGYMFVYSLILLIWIPFAVVIALFFGVS